MPLPDIILIFYIYIPFNHILPPSFGTLSLHIIFISLSYKSSYLVYLSLLLLNP